MKNLLNEWPLIRQLSVGTPMVLFLDYDGTLARIVRNPDQARPTNRMARILRELSACSRLRLVFISGRPLADLRRRIGLRGCIYAGSHGWEMQGPRWMFRQRLPENMAKILRILPEEIYATISRYPDAWMESKDHSLTIHYRTVSAHHVRRLKADVHDVCRPHIGTGEIKIRSGKKIIEILPDYNWNKGEAAAWILEKKFRAKRSVVFYIGDDSTDEDAFVRLRGRAVTIRVGRKVSSAADYYLPGVNAVRVFLEDLGSFLKGSAI